MGKGREQPKSPKSKNTLRFLLLLLLLLLSLTMNYRQDNWCSQCQSTTCSSYPAHHNMIDEQSIPFRHIYYSNGFNPLHLDPYHVDAYHADNTIPYDTLHNNNPSWHHQPAWPASSPSASPTSSNSPISSGSEELMGNHPALFMQPMSSPNCTTRYATASSSHPVRSSSSRHTRYTRPYIAKTEPVVHETYEVETGEEDVINAVIHRLTDEEKRNLNFTTATPRPTFCCKVQGCGRWILHRTQVKLHLSEHGYRFGKPYKCACGAEFGRQVEAMRHVEDKKLCDHCHKSGRKYKGGAICLRCLRRLTGK